MVSKKKCIFILIPFILFIEVILAFYINKKSVDEKNYLPEKHTIQNFYNEPYFENSEIVESLYLNKGIFEFLCIKDSCTDIQILERYLKINIPYSSKLSDYDLCKLDEKEMSDMLFGEAYRITAVLVDESQSVYKTFNKYKSHIIEYGVEKHVSIFEKYFDIKKYGIQLKESCWIPDSYIYYTKDGSVNFKQMDTYLFFSEPSIDNKQFVFIVKNGVGLTEENDY